MLQDLDYGRMENEFHNIYPSDEDIVVCFRGNMALVHRSENNELRLPAYKEVLAWAEVNNWESWNENRTQYVFRLQDVNYFIWWGEGGESGDPSYVYESTMSLRQMTSKNIAFGIMTAWHLFDWYRSNRFCGRDRKSVV